MKCWAVRQGTVVDVFWKKPKAINDDGWYWSGECLTFGLGEFRRLFGVSLPLDEPVKVRLECHVFTKGE